MNIEEQFLEAIDIIVEKKIKNKSALIYTGVVNSILSNNKCNMSINGENYNILYYGNVPLINKMYKVFVPQDNMSLGFIIVPAQEDIIDNSIENLNNILTNHIHDTSNPHDVDKQQISLNNVDNVRQYSSINPPPYPVTSVNGETGVVNLSAEDVNAVPLNRTINGKSLTSNINLTASDIGADSYGDAANVQNNLNIHINNNSNPHNVDKNQIGLGNVANVLQYSANNPPPYPVLSVNGSTGAVSLTANDVGAVPTSRTINGQSLSSNITLDASDVGALSTSGGTLTGNLTGKYITGTWLQSTAVTNYNSNNYKGICVFDNSGWIYLRTPSQILTDIGVNNISIQVSSSQPSNQNSGDFWYQIT